MTFAWPLALLLLLVPPLVVLLYVLQRRRRRRFAVRYASLALVREAMPAQSRWRRRVPFALFLLALVSLAIGAARPEAEVTVPTSRTTIILALDVSLSMCSTDVPPNRLTVAQQVARTFVQDQPSGTRIGLVAFSGIAQLVVPPTTDRSKLVSAIDGLTTGRGTAIGTALLRAIDAIAEVNPNVAPSGVPVAGATPTAGPPSGGYQPDIVVLLTDGATTQGIDPIAAARQAAARGLRVYTIGFGTGQVASLACSRAQLGNDVFAQRFAGGGGFGGFGFDRFGGFGGNGRRSPLLIDETALRGIADTTGGTYHRAQDANQLVNVFHGLPADVMLQRERIELSVVFAGVGAVLALAAVGLSLAWNRQG